MSSSSYMPPAKSDTHLTPDRVYEIIQANWGFKEYEMFDPCPKWCIWDGLQIDWENLNYVNPPYSTLSQWVDRAILMTNEDKTTIMLLPAKTDQLWFHKLIEGKYEIVWIRRRLKFKNNKWGATQPHFLVRIK